ncbi:MAG TPA: glutamyl-tRNA reductase [Polyangiaceae bacterium]|nr:glutamyl-tRNA reductase [Polyangiaceae bacterium]
MIFVVGLSHRTAPVDVRERLSAGADALPEVIARLAARRELAEVMFLSTCNRVEVAALPNAAAGIDAARDAIREELARHGGVAGGAELATYLYEKRGEEAVRHIFRVAASLDSMVLGEPQILGQVKDAHDAAIAAGALKGTLGRCVSRAFLVAKRVRSETSIGAGSVSISSVAVDLAQRIFGDLRDHAVLLLGAGEMAEAAARSLGKDARALRICNRSFERAAALAAEMHAAAVPWEGLEAELVSADVVVASTASRAFVVTREMVKRAMRARKGRTLFFVDIAVPRNVDPAAHGIDNAYVFNVDDLEQEVARGMKARHAELDAAEAIVAEEVAQFHAWTRGLEVQPTVVALRSRVREVIAQELERALSGRLKHLPDGDRATLTRMVDGAVGKLLHGPTTKLKARAAEGEDARELAAAVRFLFDLQDAREPPEEGEGAAAPDEDERLAN